MQEPGSLEAQEAWDLQESGSPRRSGKSFWKSETSGKLGKCSVFSHARSAGRSADMFLNMLLAFNMRFICVAL